MENNYEKYRKTTHVLLDRDVIKRASENTNKITNEPSARVVYQSDLHMSQPSLSSDQKIGRKTIVGYASQLGGTLSMVAAGVDTSIPIPVATVGFLAGLVLAVLGTKIAESE